MEIVRRANAAFTAGDWDALVELYHPDIEFRDLQHAPDLPEVLRGVDSIGLALTNWTDAYDEFGAEIHEYIDAEPWVIMDVYWHGKGKGSEIRVDLRQADACKIEDGKIVSWTIGYVDVATALEVLRDSE